MPVMVTDVVVFATIAVLGFERFRPGDLLRYLKRENVHDQIRSLVQQNDVSADQDVGAIRRRGRQLSLQFDRHRIHALLQTRGKRPVTDQLLFESRRQAIFFGQTRRKMALVLGIPAADGLFVSLIAVGAIIILPLLVVTFAVSMTLAIALGKQGNS